jgi:AAA15 family ATPase/GTPase
MDLNVAGKKLINLKNINVIIGKNDCGKSSILRYFSQLQTDWSHFKYITPERGR